MAIARVVNNEIVEIRDLHIAQVPEHKKYLWKTYIEDKPSLSDFEDYVNTELIITSNTVTKVWNKENREISVYDVQAERRKRLSEGFDYDFGDERGVHRIGTTPADMMGWDEVAKLANALINKNQGNNTIDIVTDTGPATITANEFMDIQVAAANFRQPIWAASFYLQTLNPIPVDFTSNTYWSNT